MPGDDRVIVTRGGQALEVPADQVQVKLDQGYTVETTPERQAREAQGRLEERTSGIANTLTAGAQALARGATLGISDVARRVLGSSDDVREARELQEAHPIAATLVEIGGALIPGGAIGQLGHAAEAAVLGEGAGLARSVAARAVGSAAEGAVYGAGNAVSQLAMSEDPLTAEHIASALSSNMLLGGGIGGVAGAAFKGVEVGLTRATAALREATAARAALESVPADLRTLDDAGLKTARKAAEAEHTADIAAEKQSLEQIRANQRVEIANQVKDFHNELATEKPIYQSVVGADIKKAVPGIATEVEAPLAKSFSALRSAFDNPIEMQKNPWKLLTPLRQQQTALENLQARMPEMQAALMGDARGRALEFVDEALQKNRAFQQAIESMDSKANPVMSGRLAKLTAGPSERMLAIDGAREALAKAPELGLIGKGVKAGVFGLGTALAHAIPGVGIAAPFLGKAASDAVEKLFTRMSGAVGKVSDKASGAASKFLGSAKALEPYAAPTATKVLSTVRFGASKAEVPEHDLAALYKARSSELFEQTMRLPDGSTVMRPEARQAMAAMLDPIRAVAPKLADMIETAKARGISLLAALAPKKPEAPAIQIGPDNSRPPDMKIREWARMVRAVEDPASVEERLARGICTPEEAQCYRLAHPERFAAVQREIFAKAPLLDKTLPMHKKVALSVFTGIPVTAAMSPNVIAVFQSTFDMEPGTSGGTTAPRPQPNFGAMGSLRDLDKPTPSQAREQGR